MESHGSATHEEFTYHEVHTQITLNVTKVIYLLVKGHPYTCACQVCFKMLLTLMVN